MRCNRDSLIKRWNLKQTHGLRFCLSPSCGRPVQARVRGRGAFCCTLCQYDNQEHSGPHLEFDYIFADVYVIHPDTIKETETALPKLGEKLEGLGAIEMANHHPVSPELEATKLFSILI